MKHRVSKAYQTRLEKMTAAALTGLLASGNYTYGDVHETIIGGREKDVLGNAVPLASELAVAFAAGALFVMQQSLNQVEKNLKACAEIGKHISLDGSSN